MMQRSVASFGLRMWRRCALLLCLATRRSIRGQNVCPALPLLSMDENLTMGVYSKVCVGRVLREFSSLPMIIELDDLSKELCELRVFALCGGQRGGSGSP